jgi:hypothetical protein
MFELIDRQPEIVVPESEYKRLLGYPADHPLEGRARELADWAREWYARHGQPWIYAGDARIEVADGTLRINDARMASPRLHDQVTAAQAGEAVLAALSAGPECEEEARRRWQEEKPDEYFFLEVYGSAVVESLLTAARARICGWADHQRMAVLPHYSPGYPGWDIADQTRLFQMIRGRKGGELAASLHVLDSGMLQPKKSLLAVFGITRRLDLVKNSAHLIPCETCSLPGCQYRRARYQDSPPQLEDVRQLGSAARAASASKGPSILNHQGKYSVNPRALRKWSQERLQLKILQDRTVEARFHYEGTTCTNLGRTLDYHYHVWLSSPEEGYVIRDLRCGPAPGDAGHTFMCEYINNRDGLTNSVANEKPLLGRPLEDVLSWRRPFCAAGCYCAPDGRQHKWGLALEVIHFALAQREKQS